MKTKKFIMTRPKYKIGDVVILRQDIINGWDGFILQRKITAAEFNIIWVYYHEEENSYEFTENDVFGTIEEIQNNDKDLNIYLTKLSKWNNGKYDQN